jgi:hypothetical protein
MPNFVGLRPLTSPAWKIFARHALSGICNFSIDRRNLLLHFRDFGFDGRALRQQPC